MAKRPRSEAQQVASRANGRRSRGPRTAEGKARSRRNAMRHGLRAEVLEVLPLEAGGPTEALVSQVRAELAPADVIEAELVDAIAVALWRLRQARQLEAELANAGAKGQTSMPLASSMLKRNHGSGAVALLLRYRNQAVGELDRLLRLLEARRSAGEGGQDMTGPRPSSMPQSANICLATANDNDPLAGTRGERGSPPPQLT